MFWKRNDTATKSLGPRDIPEIVKKHIESVQMIDPGLLPFFKAVVKESEKGGKALDIYIFDPSDAQARGIEVKNYETVRQHPEITIAEGWFNEADKKVELTAKKAIPKIKLFNYQEILQQIEGLKEPGSSVFFFVNAGNTLGGPLGRGAAVIRLNANSDGKKTKKYSVFMANVIDMQPIKSENKLWDEDKSKNIAQWLSNSHQPRFF